MKITYDAEVDALYIQFLETKVTTDLPISIQARQRQVRKAEQ